MKKHSRRRVRRLERRHAKGKRRPLLNLVALMDVFSILVFFFLIHASAVMVNARPDFVTLPESTASQSPRHTVVVTITPNAIFLQGDHVAEVTSALASSKQEIGGLKTALREKLGRESLASEKSGEKLNEVTIMGDRTIPFELLKKVMVTCSRAGYRRISLSVLQKSYQTG